MCKTNVGCVGAQFWVAYVPFEVAGPGAARVMFEQLEVARRLVAAYPDTLQPAFSADDIDCLCSVMGAEHVGIGSDFDGIDEVPEGLEDVSKFPDLFVELARRGYSDD